MTTSDTTRAVVGRFNILRESRAIFVHIPKTGGSSIRELLGLPIGDYSHPTAKEYEKAFPEEWGRFYKFAVVRNPWDRFVSAYFYNLSIAERIPNRIRRQIKRYGKDFCGFVRDYGPKKEFLLSSSAAFRPQNDWLHGLDRIGRFEELDTFARELSSTLNLRGELPHQNASNRESYQAYFDDETAALVGNLYEEDISRLNYRFGD